MGLRGKNGMMAFSKLLNEIIKENDSLTIYNISKALDCDRSWLQRVVLGKRSMNYDKMIPLCSYLKHFVSNDVVNELYESFAVEYFGNRDYQNVLYIKRRLRSMEENEKYIHFLAAQKRFDIEKFLSERGSDKNVKKLLQEIFYMIERQYRNKSNLNFICIFPLNGQM
jgi:hypothetical protein